MIDQRRLIKAKHLSWVLTGLFLILTACSTMMGLAPVKESTERISDWLIVPVFYATNRVRNTDSNAIDYIEQKNDKGLLFGIKNIIIPYPASPSLAHDTMEHMGWQSIHLQNPLPPGEVPPILQEHKMPDQEFSAAQMVKAFDKYYGITGSDEAVLFIHGCCATYKTSMERAAKLTVQMGAPVVVYDWVSPIGFTHYLANETLAEQSYDDFCKFLDAVAKYVPPANTTLIGHSMGAAFVDEALVRRFQRTYGGQVLPKYREIILSQPDIDARSYLKHDKHIVSQAEKTRIFMVLDDSRLKASSLAHGRFERLGRPGPLLSNLCQLDKQDIIDMTITGIGHNLPYNFIASMHRTGTINEEGYKAIRKEPHLFVLEKTTKIQE